MTNEVKEYSVIIDPIKGPIIKKVSKPQIDTFVHDVVEGYFEAIELPRGIFAWPQERYIVLVNEEGIMKNLQFNPWATMILRYDRKGIIILGNAVIFRINKHDLEPLTKDEAYELVLRLRRA